jgi:uncharacterized protein
MHIQNQIEVAAPPDELFDILSDVESVAPLLPGATLEGKQDDGSYAGTVKVKVGPISVTYRGTLYFAELDHEARKAVMEASGQEINGQGSTQATITATVSGSGSTSVLTMDTDMEVRGKVAQFGRGAIDNVSQKILDQFAHNLEAQVLSSEQQAAAGTQSSQDSAGGPSERATESGEALNALSLLPVPSVRQAVPAVVALALGLLIGILLRSSKSRDDMQIPMGEASRTPGYPGPVYLPLVYPPVGHPPMVYPPAPQNETSSGRQRR